jgi:DNA-binding XRE family transcriptional regulator
MSPHGNTSAQGESPLLIPHGNAGRAMDDDTGRTALESCAEGLAARFGALVRGRREAMGLRQEDIAFATGFGRRFIIELEAGKASCQLGKALAVASAVGLRPLDLAALGNREDRQSPPGRATARLQEPARG